MGLWTFTKKFRLSFRKKRLAKGSAFWVNFYKKYDDWAQEHIAKKVRKLPVNPNLIFFDSFIGRNVADSPLALYNSIRKNPAYAGYTFVWTTNDVKKNAQLGTLPRTRLVKRLTVDYYEAICTAKYVINNITNNVFAKKQEGQIYIQTWHGTPLKRLGMDIQLDGNAWKSKDGIHEQYEREGKTFDYLLSPSPYATEKLGSAFGLNEEDKKKKIIELGYPRNVELFTCTEERKAEIKKQYNIPEGKKVILYCTTWREHVYKFGSGFPYQVELDLEQLYKRFGDTACVIMRMHYNHKKTPIDFASYKGFLYNGTPVNNINKLFVIADLLVTDYSSVMFDFANLRRPLVFYMYDQERYANEVRGLYFDPSELPGPIVRNQNELEDAIEELLSKEFVPDEKYKAFNEKFNCLDDAYAADRVIDRLITPKTEADPVPKALLKYEQKRKRKARIRGKIRSCVKKTFLNRLLG